MIGRPGAPGARLAGLISGTLACLAMVVVGCTQFTRGDAAVAAGQAAPYRSSVASSIAASVSSSRARESERRATQAVVAVHRVCDAMSTTSANAIAALNNYVAAFNADPTDTADVADEAVDALNGSATEIARKTSDEVPAAVRDALAQWADAALRAATAIAESYPTAAFNAAVDHLNSAKGVALDRCDEAYR